MGLLLSILVSCVGVVELLTFYSNVSRNLQVTPRESSRDFSDLITYCLLRLQNEHLDISSQIRAYREVLDDIPNGAIEGRYSPYQLTPYNLSRSPSPISCKFKNEQHLNGNLVRRSPSPYPTFILTNPRNSICSDLEDNPKITVVEVDEELYSNSGSSSPNLELDQKNTLLESTSYNSNDFWSNRLGVSKRSKSRSRSRSPDPLTLVEPDDLVEISLRKRTSKSPRKNRRFLRRRSLSESSKVELLNHRHNGDLRKTSSNCQLVESAYWNKSPSPFEPFLKSPTMDLDRTSKILSKAAEKLNGNGGKLEGASGVTKKTPEPFWVNLQE